MRSLLGLVVLLLVNAPVVAQEPYEFGIRFRPQNFGPAGFRGFSYSGQTYRNRFGQSIQFGEIDFPSFRSSIVRQRLAASDYVNGGRQGRTRDERAPLSAGTRPAQQRGPYYVATSTSDRAAGRRGQTVIARSNERRATGVGRPSSYRTADVSTQRIAFPPRTSRVADGRTATARRTATRFGPGDSFRAAAARVRTARR